MFNASRFPGAAPRKCGAAGKDAAPEDWGYHGPKAPGGTRPRFSIVLPRLHHFILFSLKLELAVLWWEIKAWVGAPRWDGNCCGYGRLTSEPRLCGGGVAGTKMLQEHI